MDAKNNTRRQESTCKFCEKPIYRKPPGDWFHVQGGAMSCFINGTYNKDEKAAPHEGAG